MVTNVISDMLRRMERPAKDQRKRLCKRISCDIEGVYTIRFVYLKILIQDGILGTNRTVKFSKCTWDQITSRERKGLREELSKCVRFMSAVFARRNCKEYISTTEK